MMSDLFTQSDTCISHVLPGAGVCAHVDTCVCVCLTPFHSITCLSLHRVYTLPEPKSALTPPPPSVQLSRKGPWDGDKTNLPLMRSQ